MKKYITLLLCMSCFFTGIFVKGIVSNNKMSSNNEISKEIFTYDKYQELFENIVNNIDVSGFEVKANTLGGNITTIDKDLSFNKREALTLYGSIDMATSKSTDEQLTLENNDKNNQITISILYLNTNIGDDFIAFPNNFGFDDLNKELIDKAVVTVFTYKNLVFLVQQVCSDKYDINLMNNVNRELIKLVRE